MNLSFAGCGYLGIYHIGVATCFRQYVPSVLGNKMTGASVGALVASTMLCDVPLGISTTSVLRVSMKARSGFLGPFQPGFDIIPILRDGMLAILPIDAHLKCNGKLHISVTRVTDGKNVLLNQFDSKDDLVEALMCSCFIPFYCGAIPPKFHGVAYMDGGFSDNQPILDDNTITVAPFCGESDICPLDSTFSTLQISLANTSISITPHNMYRFARILFPGHCEMLSRLCQQGFDDALRFLQTRNMISCTRCLSIRSSFRVSNTVDDECDRSRRTSTDSCRECRKLLNSMPASVQKVLQDACDQVNKGILNCLMKYPSVKVLSFLLLPYILPVDLGFVMLCKLWNMVPKVHQEVHSGVTFLQSLGKRVVNSFSSYQQYSAKISCQLSVTEFNYSLNGPQLSQRSDTSSLVSQGISIVDSNKASLEDINGLQSPSAIHNPERVISNVKFDLTVDLPPSTVKKTKQQQILEAVNTLRTHNSYNANHIAASSALSWKKECIGICSEIQPQQIDTIEKIFDFTDQQEALMAYYYLDKGMKLKMTEIFNVTDQIAPAPDVEVQQ